MPAARDGARDDRVAVVVEAVNACGYAVAPRFLDARTVAGLRARALSLEADGLLAPAGIGRGPQRIERAAIRGDRIRWLGDPGNDAVEKSLHEALEALRLAFNRELALGLFEFEGHYALYAPGAGYARHRDRFHDDDARLLSVVLYLNGRWRAHDGGLLRLHRENDRAVDVLPIGGTLVAFLADRFEHEVLPARRSRLSVTGWFRRRA